MYTSISRSVYIQLNSTCDIEDIIQVQSSFVITMTQSEEPGSGYRGPEDSLSQAYIEVFSLLVPQSAATGVVGGPQRYNLHPKVKPVYHLVTKNMNKVKKGGEMEMKSTKHRCGLYGR